MVSPALAPQVPPTRSAEPGSEEELAGWLQRLRSRAARASMEVMGVPQVDRLYTAEDLAQLGDAFRGELIEGRLVPISPSKRLHGVVCANVATELGMWCRIRDPGFRLILGECGFIVARRPDVVLVPDLALVARARDAILDDPFLPGFGAAVSQLVM